MPLVSQQECEKKSACTRILSFKNDFDVVTNLDYGVTSSLSWLSFTCESQVGSSRIWVISHNLYPFKGKNLEWGVDKLACTYLNLRFPFIVGRKDIYWHEYFINIELDHNG